MLTTSCRSSLKSTKQKCKLYVLSFPKAAFGLRTMCSNRLPREILPVFSACAHRKFIWKMSETKFKAALAKSEAKQFGLLVCLKRFTHVSAVLSGKAPLMHSKTKDE